MDQEQYVICKGCNKVIKWIKMESGKNMPVDTKLITVVTIDGKVVRGYIPHWSTCEKYKQFKKK